MSFRLTTIERAYALAKSGECGNLGEIKGRLKSEGFHDVNGQLYGKTIADDLRRLCAAARTGAEGDRQEA